MIFRVFTALAAAFLATTLTTVAAIARTPDEPPAPPMLAAMMGAAISVPELSPSGRYLAYVHTENGIDQLVISDLDAKTSDTLFKTKPAPPGLEIDLRQRIVSIQWKGDEHLILGVAVPETGISKHEIEDYPILTIFADRDGSHPFTINTRSYGAVQEGAGVIDTLPDDPDHVLVQLPNGQGTISVFRLNLRDHTSVLVEHGGTRVVGFGTNSKGEVTTRQVVADAGFFSGYALILQARTPGETEWREILEIQPKRSNVFTDYDYVASTDDPNAFLVLAYPDKGQGDTRTLRLLDTDRMKLGPVIFGNATYDLDHPLLRGRSRDFMAGCYWVDVLVCEFKDKTYQARYDKIAGHFGGKESFELVSRAKDDSRWIISATAPDDPGSVYVYDAKTEALTDLGSIAPNLDHSAIGHTRKFEYKARDGKTLSGYLTLPPHATKPPPLIVMPHGGPEARDQWEFNLWVQYLASRGYAVLQPNFRGSGGFGRTFAEAGYRQWGGRMSEDLDDAVKAEVASGEIDPKRICIVGASYGGYAALYEAGTKPNLYRCAVSVDGLGNLTASMEWVRNHRGANSGSYRYWLRNMGDPKTDAAMLAATSPVNMIKDWSVPTLLIHGDADEIVDVGQSREMRDALKRAHKDVEYDEVKHMQHGPSTPREWVRVMTEIDTFVGRYIGPN